MTQQLAIDGGPKAVMTKYRERWRSTQWSGLAQIARLARRDVNTIANGGGAIAEFEEAFAQVCNRRYGLAMNSGTSSLHSAYYAAGAGPGTEVIVPSYTFFASAAPILACGAVPVFCDVDRETLVADPDDVESRITDKTVAICVVHLWGNPAPMDRFADIARRHDLKLIEDCSHAHGAQYQGRPVGSWGDFGCFSLQGKKAVSGGEAGIAVCDDPELFDRMLLLGHYGRLKAGQAADTFATDHLTLGVKYRPHLYAILLARASLRRLDELNRRRRRHYALLQPELEGCAAVRPVATTPGALRGGFLEFILHYDPDAAGGWSAKRFVKAAKAEGIPLSEERYSRIGDAKRPLHRSPIFAAHGPADLPVTEGLGGTLLKLPPFTKVSERYVRQCAAGLRKVAAGAAAQQRTEATTRTPSPVRA